MLGGCSWRLGGFWPSPGQAALSAGCQNWGRVGLGLQAAKKPGGWPGCLATLILTSNVINNSGNNVNACVFFFSLTFGIESKRQLHLCDRYEQNLTCRSC